MEFLGFSFAIISYIFVLWLLDRVDKLEQRVANLENELEEDIIVEGDEPIEENNESRS